MSRNGDARSRAVADVVSARSDPFAVPAESLAPSSPRFTTWAGRSLSETVKRSARILESGLLDTERLPRAPACRHDLASTRCDAEERCHDAAFEPTQQSTITLRGHRRRFGLDPLSFCGACSELRPSLPPAHADIEGIFTAKWRESRIMPSVLDVFSSATTPSAIEPCLHDPVAVIPWSSPADATVTT